MVHLLLNPNEVCARGKAKARGCQREMREAGYGEEENTGTERRPTPSLPPGLSGRLWPQAATPTLGAEREV